ncbi:MAG: signal peptidase I [Marmoricola sp.]
MTIVAQPAEATAPRPGNRSARLRRTTRGGLTGAALILTAIAFWVTLAPVSLGGPASYVVTDGTSMLPRFEANGLVVTRASDDYRVGDVVAYHNADLHAVVMHRIVARDGGRYVFKGDNNDFEDTYHARAADLVGKEWTYWPGAGRYLVALRQPTLFAVIIAAVAAVSFRAPRHNRKRARHHAR